MADENIERIVRYEADTSQAVSQLDKLTAATQRNAEQMDNVAGQLSAINTKIDFAAVFTIAKEVITEVASAIQGVIDRMDQLGKSAQQVGLTVDKVQELQYAFGFAGLKSAETVTVLGKLTDKLADIDDLTSKSTRSLRAMGVTAGDDAAAAVNKMADAFHGMADGTEKTSLAVDTFGRALGMKMIPALNDGSEAITKLMAEQGQYGQISEETAKQASDFNDKMTRLAEVAATVGNAIVAELLPPLNKFLQWCLDMVGPVSKAISWLSELNAKFSAGAIAAKQFSIASQVGPPTAWKGMADSVGAFSEEMKKAAEDEAGPKWLRKFGEGARDAAEGFAQLPQKIAKLREDISFLDPTVAKDALLIQSYTKQLSALEKQLDTTEKKRAGAKPSAAALSEWEKWIASLTKLENQTDISDQKIAYLQGTLNDLEAAGTKNTAWTEALRKELDRLKPDPLATAMKKIADAAKEIDEGTPRMMVALQMQLDLLVSTGQGATTQARLLREELLKMEAAKDPVAAVTLELDKMRATLEKNAKLEAEWFNALASGRANSAEFAQGVNAVLPQVQKELDTTKDKTKSLSDSIGEMGGKFVGDFSDKLVESFGKVDNSFSDMIESMLKQLLKLLLNSQLQALFKAVEGGGGWGALFSGSAAAQGKAWDANGIELMARGGILNHPMLFANGGRLAVAGEAGPEGVVPLRRGASGDLGVAASPVVVNINNNAPVEVTQQSRTDSDGTKQIDIYIEQKVKGMFTSGNMDRTMRQGYGLTRQPVAG